MATTLAVPADDHRYPIDAMQLTLMSAVPHKRFEYAPACRDGRGGWTFSQFGADRYVAKPELHALRLGLAIWVVPSIERDYVEQTTLTARFGGAVIGSNTLDWKLPNKGGAHHADGSVYEWLQEVDTPIEQSGLITISITVRLHSQPAEQSVDGCALVHTSIRDTNDQLVDANEYSALLSDPARSSGWWPEVTDNHPMHRSGGGWLSRLFKSSSPPPGDR